jgi:hypothetical protein
MYKKSGPVQRFNTGCTVRESNAGCGENIRTHPDRPWDPPSLLYTGYRVSFPGVTRPGRCVDHPPPSSAEVKERVELYLYSPLTAFMRCSRVKHTFTFTIKFRSNQMHYFYYLKLKTIYNIFMTLKYYTSVFVCVCVCTRALERESASARVALLIQQAMRTHHTEL